MEIKNGTFSGKQGKNHIQGMAVDEENGFIYFSFTTKLIKTDLCGRPVGSVTGLIGHLGCISFNKDDGLVYGSLEYKHDGIGRGILRSLGDDTVFGDGFYIAVFDVSKINAPGMDAEKDGIMTAVFLKEVLDDYNGSGAYADGKPAPHRYGCSGIDGLCIAPLPGGGEKMYLYTAYGIYSDTGRNDNDHQILLCFDMDGLKSRALPLSQKNMHTSGPERPEHKYFVYTGNTEYGVQNLEYDPFTSSIITAVYRGKKKEFTNYDIFAVDLTKKARTAGIKGTDETGECLTLVGSPGPESGDIKGWSFPFGQYGIYSRGDGRFYVAEPACEDGEEAAYVNTYRFDKSTGFTKEEA